MVWTGEEVLVWGGEAFTEEWQEFADGAAWVPGPGTWRLLPEAPIAGRGYHSAVWTGEEMLVWGGRTDSGCMTAAADGAAYDPDRDAWRVLPDGPLRARSGHTAVWTGEEMLVWGGLGTYGDPVAGGCAPPPPDAGTLGAAAYNPTTDRWRPLAEPPLPSRSHGFTAVWSGDAMLIWGGVDGPNPSSDRPILQEATRRDGLAYDPATDTWDLIPPGPLSARKDHTAAWSGREMLVWGGEAGAELGVEGAGYDPATGTWRTLAPSPLGQRYGHTAVAADGLMVVWGGCCAAAANGGAAYDDGAVYDPPRDTWTTLPPTDLRGRTAHRAVFTGQEMFVWGGDHFQQHGGDAGEHLLLADGGALAVELHADG